MPSRSGRAQQVRASLWLPVMVWFAKEGRRCDATTHVVGRMWRYMYMDKHQRVGAIRVPSTLYIRTTVLGALFSR
ncbi:hypothetical protein V8C37DRAFT_373160 [Trichoderma ceciliae]